MTEFVKHGAHPAFILPNVAQDSNVAFMIDIHAERVLRLAVAFVKVGGAKQVFDLESDAAIVSPRERLDVPILEDFIQGFRRARRRELLKERIAVQPWVTFSVRNSELSLECDIQCVFHLRES